MTYPRCLRPRPTSRARVKMSTARTRVPLTVLLFPLAALPTTTMSLTLIHHPSLVRAPSLPGSTLLGNLQAPPQPCLFVPKTVTILRVSLDSAYWHMLSLTVLSNSCSCTEHSSARSKPAPVHHKYFTSLSSGLFYFSLQSQLKQYKTQTRQEAHACARQIKITAC